MAAKEESVGNIIHKMRWKGQSDQISDGDASRRHDPGRPCCTASESTSRHLTRPISSKESGPASWPRMSSWPATPLKRCAAAIPFTTSPADHFSFRKTAQKWKNRGSRIRLLASLNQNEKRPCVPAVCQFSSPPTVLPPYLRAPVL